MELEQCHGKNTIAEYSYDTDMNGTVNVGLTKVLHL